ncbi:MAG: AmmeMemoRadiSam system protein B [Candidatus Aminicenantes bacterium]|nr:AmmeMemoRadiSam system protein B [Candidatus Aminicenantes bacterium]
MMFTALLSQDIRPIRDDVGYCWKKEQISNLIDYLESEEKENNCFPDLIAGISPHDDYLYAGRVYYPLFKNIQAREVLIFGVTHSTVRKKIGDPHNKLIFENYQFWKGPFKKVHISPLRDFLKEKMNQDYIQISNQAHQLEHSIESTIPFLQYYNPEVQITPIMVTGMPFKQMEKISNEISEFIVSYIKRNRLKLGKDIFILISADANHYGEDFNNTVFGTGAHAHQQATALDKKILHSCLQGSISRDKIKKLSGLLWGKTYRENSNTLWCGKYSIPFGLLTLVKIVKRLDIKTTLKGNPFKYSDTYSSGVIPLKKAGLGITAPFSLKHWVGFFSAGFYLE